MRDHHLPIRISLCAPICAAGIAAAVALPTRAAETATWPARPSMSAACDAWDSHIQDLIEQHRLSTDLDDAEFGNALSLYYSAKSHCSLGDTQAALAIYDALPLAPVRQRPLR
jgi:hypothetical protein